MKKKDISFRFKKTRKRLRLLQVILSMHAQFKRPKVSDIVCVNNGISRASDFFSGGAADGTSEVAREFSRTATPQGKILQILTIIVTGSAVKQSFRAQNLASYEGYL